MPSGTRDVLVVDASVVVKFFVPEADSEAAWRLADSDVALVAPAHALGEILEILRRKMLAGDIRPQTFWEAVRTLDQGLDIVPLEPLLAAAAEIAVSTGASFYDALYVAAAGRNGTRVVTADLKLVARMHGSLYESLVTPLVAWEPPAA